MAHSLTDGQGPAMAELMERIGTDGSRLEYEDADAANGLGWDAVDAALAERGLTITDDGTGYVVSAS